MAVINIFSELDETLQKAKLMLVVTTITSFFEYCIDEKLEPTVDNCVKFFNEKYGQSVDNEFIIKILEIMAGNVKLFVMFMVNEQVEKIADNMLDIPSSLSSTIRRIF